MNDKERQEWLRHMEVVQWSSITVFTAVVAGLAVIVVSDKDPTLPAIGLVFTSLTLHFTAGFRASRRSLSLEVRDRELRSLLARKGKQSWPSMWSTFVLAYAAVDAFFVYNLWHAVSGWWPRSIVAVGCLVSVGYAAYAGSGVPVVEAAPERHAEDYPPVEAAVS